MKLIFLNAWHGELRPALTDFISEQKEDTDIFCLMEADEKGIRSWCREILVEYREEVVEKSMVKGYFALTCFARADLELVNTKSIIRDPSIGVAQFLSFQTDGELFNLCNVHGIPYHPDNKLDTPGRIKQSDEIIKFMNKQTGAKIVGGDFNLMPETKSVKMFEANGYDDLIKNFGITNTRNHYAWDRYPKTPQKFADYCFTKSVKVNNYEVPMVEVSDHLPQILEIDF